MRRPIDKLILALAFLLIAVLIGASSCHKHYPGCGHDVYASVQSETHQVPEPSTRMLLGYGVLAVVLAGLYSNRNRLR